MSSSSSALDALRQLARQQQLAQEALTAAQAAPVPPQLANLPPHILLCVSREKLLKQTPIYQCPPWAGMPADRNAHLEVSRDGAKIADIGVGRLPFYLIGQGAECDIRLENPSISRYHCVIVHNPQRREFVLIDMSTNGTRVNGARVEKRREVTLRYGDVITFGESPRQYKLVKEKSVRRLTAAERVSEPDPPAKAINQSLVVASSAPPTASPAAAAAAVAPAVEVAAPPPVLKRHFYQILLKHKDVDNPVSKNPAHNGTVVTRSIDDAIELATQLREVEGITNAETFADLCKEFGECSRAKKGGDLGEVEQGMYGDAFDIAAFSLGPGCISMPFTTELGVHLVLRVADSS